METIGHFGAVHKAHLIKWNTSGQSHIVVVAAKMIKGKKFVIILMLVIA